MHRSKVDLPDPERANDHHHFTLTHIQAYPSQGMDSAEVFMNILDMDNWFHYDYLSKRDFFSIQATPRVKNKVSTKYSKATIAH